ncbi:hypothetical protein NFI96_023416, partial [Prochilodus magdalenae]
AVTILAPFEELTRQVSFSDALVSDVIPVITVLQRQLFKETDEEQGIKTMTSTLLTAVQKRFADMEQNPLFSTFASRAKVVSGSDYCEVIFLQEETGRISV